MINIALFGPPGAGKGTQSKLLLEKYNLAYIATGDILRKEISENTELGQKAKSIIEKGGLVSDEIIVQIIERTILENKDVSGFLFDGFPRTYVQAYILEGLLLKLNTSLTCMLSLNVPRNELVNRLLERSKTSMRIDDTPEVIQTRLEEYEQKTAPVADFYKEKGIYIDIEGTGNISEVFDRINMTIETMLRKVWMNIVLVGYPGAGKGTQAIKLDEKFNLVYISTGDMMRYELANNTDVGNKIKPHLEKGTIVPDEIAIKLIESKIKMNPKANGFIFKGFPRNLVQAYILDGMLRKMNSTISRVIYIDVPVLEAIKRLNTRAKSNKSRPYDMNTDLILQRLEEFEKITYPVVDYYKKLDKLVTLSGIGTEDEIQNKVFVEVEKTLRQIR